MYDLLLNLLGKSLDSPEFQQLLNAAGSPSSVYVVPIDEYESLKMFEFYKYGFGVSYSMQLDSFKMLGCEYESDSSLRPMCAFPDPGPHGIFYHDSKRLVQKKMAVLPTSSRKLKSYIRVTYKIEPHVVECLFDGKGNVLKGFTVALLKDKHARRRTC